MNKMNKNNTCDTMLNLSEFVTTHMGLHFPERRWDDLESKVSSAVRELDLRNTKSYVNYLLSSSDRKKDIETLAACLTIGETYFFRDKDCFNTLEKHIIPELISSRTRKGRDKYLRIWSAACCTGEEPYSIAILLDKMIPNLKDWDVTIMGSDINHRFLQKAAEGVYKEWSFRDVPLSIKKEYFRVTNNGSYEIIPRIKKMVKFFNHNLIKEVNPSLVNNAMDLIFCRNAIMYFDTENRKSAIRHLYNSLTDGGSLVVSACEVSNEEFSQFVTVNYQGTYFYRKDINKPEKPKTKILKAYNDINKTDNQQPARTGILSRRNAVGTKNGRARQAGEPTIEKLQSEIVNRKPTINNQQPATDNHKKKDTQQDLYNEALLLYKQACYEEVTEKIDTLLSREEGNTEAMILLARAYANQGKIADAHTLCDKAISLNKSNHSYHYLLATILLEKDELKEAAIALKNSIYLDHNFVLAHFAMGSLMQQQDEFKKAEKHFNNALFILAEWQQDDILPESEGMTAGRLKEIIQSIKTNVA